MVIAQSFGLTVILPLEIALRVSLTITIVASPITTLFTRVQETPAFLAEVARSGAMPPKALHAESMSSTAHAIIATAVS